MVGRKHLFSEDINQQSETSPDTTETDRDQDIFISEMSSTVLDDPKSFPFSQDQHFISEVDGNTLLQRVLADVEPPNANRRRRNERRGRRREISDDHAAFFKNAPSLRENAGRRSAPFVPIPPPVMTPIDTGPVALGNPGVQFELSQGSLSRQLSGERSPTRFQGLPPHIRFNHKPQEFVRVCFSNRGFNKVVGQTGVDVETPDRSTVVNVANLISDLIVENTPAVGVKSVQEFFGIDYIGYIIDKERLDQETGEWIRTDEYRIAGSEASSFKDSRVAYGHCYRYRIRSVIKATLKNTKVLHTNLEFTENLRRFEQDRIKEQLQVKRDAIALASQVTNVGLLGKSSAGEGRRGTFSLNNLLRSDDPNNQRKLDRGGNNFFNMNLSPSVSVSADQRETNIVRVPLTDPRKTIRNLRRSENLAVSDIDMMRGTISQTALQSLINTNLQAFKETVVEYNSFYYEGYPSNNWVYVDTTENIPPPPPTAIKIVPNTLRREIMVSWLMPVNSQRDIGGKKGGFRLYRRNSVGQRWRIIGAFEENENVYIDRNVRLNRQYIYALSSIDAHGFESFLSTQIQAELNSNYDLEQREKPLKWISGSGTQPKESNVVLRKFTARPPPIIARNSLFISPTREFNDTEKCLVIKVTSLDTHEQKEFKVDLRNINTRDTD